VRQSACRKVEEHLKGIAKVHRRFVGTAKLSTFVTVQAKLHQMADEKLKELREQSEEAEEALHSAAETKFKLYQKHVRKREQKLGQTLKKIRVVRLPSKLDWNTVKVPLFKSEAILVNGDKASFADVISPYTLIQAKNMIMT
jgi:hypothetical protein